MFVLLNIYIEKDEKEFIPLLVYNESFENFEDAKNEMAKQVQDALTNHYYDEDLENNITYSDKETRINAEIEYDWWRIIEV